MKIPPQSTLSGFFDKKIQEFDEWIVEVFEPFFEFWPTVRRAEPNVQGCAVKKVKIFLPQIWT